MRKNELYSQTQRFTATLLLVCILLQSCTGVHKSYLQVLESAAPATSLKQPQDNPPPGTATAQAATARSHRQQPNSYDCPASQPPEPKATMLPVPAAPQRIFLVNTEGIVVHFQLVGGHWQATVQEDYDGAPRPLTICCLEGYSVESLRRTHPAQRARLLRIQASQVFVGQQGLLGGMHTSHKPSCPHSKREKPNSGRRSTRQKSRSSGRRSTRTTRSSTKKPSQKPQCSCGQDHHTQEEDKKRSSYSQSPYYKRPSSGSIGVPANHPYYRPNPITPRSSGRNINADMSEAELRMSLYRAEIRGWLYMLEESKKAHENRIANLPPRERKEEALKEIRRLNLLSERIRQDLGSSTNSYLKIGELESEISDKIKQQEGIVLLQEFLDSASEPSSAYESPDCDSPTEEVAQRKAQLQRIVTKWRKREKEAQKRKETFSKLLDTEYVLSSIYEIWRINEKLQEYRREFNERGICLKERAENVIEKLKIADAVAHHPYEILANFTKNIEEELKKTLAQDAQKKSQRQPSDFLDHYLVEIACTGGSELGKKVEQKQKALALLMKDWNEAIEIQEKREADLKTDGLQFASMMRRFHESKWQEGDVKQIQDMVQKLQKDTEEFKKAKERFKQLNAKFSSQAKEKIKELAVLKRAFKVECITQFVKLSEEELSANHEAMPLASTDLGYMLDNDATAHLPEATRASIAQGAQLIKQWAATVTQWAQRKSTLIQGMIALGKEVLAIEQSSEAGCKKFDEQETILSERKDAFDKEQAEFKQKQQAFIKKMSAISTYLKSVQQQKKPPQQQNITAEDEEEAPKKSSLQRNAALEEERKLARAQRRERLKQHQQASSSPQVAAQTAASEAKEALAQMEASLSTDGKALQSILQQAGMEDLTNTLTTPPPSNIHPADTDTTVVRAQLEIPTQSPRAPRTQTHSISQQGIDASINTALDTPAGIQLVQLVGIVDEQSEDWQTCMQAVLKVAIEKLPGTHAPSQEVIEAIKWQIVERAEQKFVLAASIEEAKLAIELSSREGATKAVTAFLNKWQTASAQERIALRKEGLCLLEGIESNKKGLKAAYREQNRMCLEFDVNGEAWNGSMAKQKELKTQLTALRQLREQLLKPLQLSPQELACCNIRTRYNTDTEQEELYSSDDERHYSDGQIQANRQTLKAVGDTLRDIGEALMTLIIVPEAEVAQLLAKLGNTRIVQKVIKNGQAFLTIVQESKLARGLSRWLQRVGGTIGKAAEEIAKKMGVNWGTRGITQLPKGMTEFVSKRFKAPEGWMKKLANNQKGTRYFNPKRPEDYIRFSEANLHPSAPTGQRVPYFQRHKDGKVLTRAGEWIRKDLADPESYHIPQSMFEELKHLMDL